MEKRYQVFVSSTFSDLQEERQEVMQALLELDCIPAGMELFPAANEDQWTLIKKVIDDCDYYIVVIAGRYGSVGPEGISYTEMEYRYALGSGKPIIAFLHKDPGSLPANMCEATPEGREKLTAFCELTKKKLVKHWASAAELGSVVSRSVIQLIKSSPAVGWVRADRVPDEGAAQEILRLKREVEALQEKIDRAKKSAPPGTENLAQGDDTITLRYYFRAGRASYEYKTYAGSISLSWNQIFSVISPLLIGESTEKLLQSAIGERIQALSYTKYKKQDQFKDLTLWNFDLENDDFQTVKVQLRALGLMEKSIRNRSVKDTKNYWTLTEYGDTLMNKLRAITKEDLLKELLA
jgi:hypothetical protein